MLLVLDNCEHVIDDCAYLSEALLSSCPNIRILATSREALCIPGEVTYTVPPLSLPDPDQPALPEQLATIDAVRLFLERARARQRDFALTPATARSVAEICRQTDGLPLAIELAAARVGQLSVDHIAARLTNALTLLTGGSRTAGPRQQTLRGALDWSYDLLSQPERALLRRVAVFAGGWSLEAAEQVGAGTDGERGEVLDLLSRLVDKSFVVAQMAASGDMRYRLLEPIRQYAQALLEESGETEEICRRHMAYYAQFAEDGEQGLKGGEQEMWLERLEREHDNFRAALLHACRPEDLATGLQLAGAIWRFWLTHGHLSEGRAWFERLLALTSQAADDKELRRLHAKALNGAGGLAYYQCDYDRASAWYEQSLALSRSLGDTRGIASCTGNLGLVMRERGDLARAATLHEESVALYRSVGDMSGAAHNLNNLGIVVQDGGDYARAAELHEESLALKRELGDHWGMGLSLANLGLLARHAGELDRAEARYKEGLELLAKVGDKVAAAACLEELAGIAGARADFGRAATLFGAAAALREAVGAPLSPHDRADYDRDLAVVRAATPDDLFTSSWSTGAAMSVEMAVAYASTRAAPAERHAGVGGATALPATSPLTRREREIAEELALGLTNRQIAEKLNIAERTVDTHVRSILSKLGLASRTQVSARLRAEPQSSGSDG
jgi:predicted ATPase/DNA-binding CsgD family transcriptional regulator